MNIDVINRQVALRTKHSVIKTLLFLKFLEKEIVLTDNELGVLAIIAEQSDKSLAIKKSIESKYVKSVQSGENFISKMVTMGLIDKISSGQRRVNENFLPEISGDFLAVTIKMHNFSEYAADQN